MVETILQITGIALDSFNIDDNLLYCTTCLIVLFCLGYMFNFFQTFMERMTAKKGR